MSKRIRGPEYVTFSFLSLKLAGEHPGFCRRHRALCLGVAHRYRRFRGHTIRALQGDYLPLFPVADGGMANMANEWVDLSDEKLARVAQDGLQGQGAPVEAMRRLRVAIETA